MVDENLIDHRLHNEFWLNEIKVKNEALKQLLSINALLLAGYAAMLFNLNYKYKNNHNETIINEAFMIAASEKSINILGINIVILLKIFIILSFVAIIIVGLLIITGPIILWVFSMFYSMKSFSLIYRNTKHELQEPCTSWKYLKSIAKEKNSTYVDSYELTVGGIILVTIIIIVVTFFKIFV
jgi:hypothetical protein